MYKTLGLHLRWRSHEFLSERSVGVLERTWGFKFRTGSAQLNRLISLCHERHLMVGVKMARREEKCSQTNTLIFSRLLTRVVQWSLLSDNHESLKATYATSSGNLKHYVLLHTCIWKTKRNEIWSHWLIVSWKVFLLWWSMKGIGWSRFWDCWSQPAAVKFLTMGRHC